MTKAEARQRNDLIKRDYLDGMSRPEIRQKYNVSKCVIDNVSKGIKRKRVYWTEVRNKLILQDYLSGMKFTEVCEKYNIRNISRILKRYNVDTRGYIKASAKPKKRKAKVIPTIDTTETDKRWINKQIIALTKQGFSVPEIMERYEVNPKRIAKVKREAGILTGKLIHSANAKNVSEIPSMGDTLIPYADNCNVRPKKYSDHYSQVIFR